MTPKQKATFILEHRKKAVSEDSTYFQEKRRQFLDWLQIQNYNPPICVLEMYPGEIKGKTEIYQYFNPLHNTRTKTAAETRLEIDKLEFEKAYWVIYETILNLIKTGFHFAIFYAEGQRSLHVIIYDFEELRELDPFRRFKAQAFFWRKIMPFGLFQYADTGVWDDGHYCPIEFAPHWKYGTIFNLVFEWIPWEDKCKN